MIIGADKEKYPTIAFLTSMANSKEPPRNMACHDGNRPLASVLLRHELSALKRGLIVIPALVQAFG